MNYLSLAELIKAAPAAKKLEKTVDGLIDTSAFVKFIGKRLNQHPVMAIQNPPHKDTSKLKQREREGRHLIVMANQMGNATMILNSHTVRRKAWLGAGFYRSGERPSFLLGVAIPLHRWREYEAMITELERYRPLMNQARTEMIAKVRQSTLAGWWTDLPRVVAQNAFMRGHNTVDPKELFEVKGDNLWDALFLMLDVIASGKLQTAGSMNRIKPLRGPDALMHAGNEVFRAGLSWSGSSIALPPFRKT